MSEEKKQELKEYQKQSYLKAKESENNNWIHIFRQTDGNKSLIVYIYHTIRLLFPSVSLNILLKYF